MSEAKSSVESSESANESEGPGLSTPAKGKKNLWIIIAAIVVVALLVSVAVLVMFKPGGQEKGTLTATIDPASVSVDAGAQSTLNVSAKWTTKSAGDKDVTSSAKFLWTLSDNKLGSLDIRAQKKTTLTAAIEAATGTIKCDVKYNNVTVTATANIVVKAPFLDSVSISPSTKTLAPSESQAFAAVALSSVGLVITSGVTFSWEHSGSAATTVGLNVTTGQNVTLTAQSDATGIGVLYCNATYLSLTKSGIANITVGQAPPRNVSYRWYDMFAVPFGEWWVVRNSTAGDHEAWTWTYPYIFRWYGSPTGNIYYYSNLRLNVTAKNAPEVNMMSNPVFLPILSNTQRGGTAVLKWNGEYMSTPEVEARFPGATAGWNDGWLFRWWGTITLDKQGAKTVLNVTEDGFNNFDSWWAANNRSSAYAAWVDNEGNKRLDIEPAYESTMQTIQFNMKANKVGDKVVVTFDTVSWGMEILLARWLARGILHMNEWYYEGFHMNATIGPERTNLDLTTVAVYGVYAYESTLIPLGQTHGEPIWTWEGLMQDYVHSTLAHRVSQYDKYSVFKYDNFAPGNDFYGDSMTFDYTPMAFNLTTNETMTFEYPTVPDTMFYIHAGSNGSVSSYYDRMVVNYSEPMPSDQPDSFLPGKIAFDNNAGKLTFQGPLYMYDWSRNQTNHQSLYDQWRKQTNGTAMGSGPDTDFSKSLIPYGCPFIEFKAYHNPGEVTRVLDHFDLAVNATTTSVGASIDATVTAKDQFNQVYTGYVGEVNLSTNASAGTYTLPANYTFTSGDAGVHVFSGVSWSVAGRYNLTVKDVADQSKKTTVSNIEVTSSVPHADYFVVVIPNVAANTLTSATVTVYSQFDEIYAGYRGTVSFTSNASVAFTVPADYQFTAGDAGIHVFSHGVSFSAAGVYNVTVTDVANSSLKGSQENIVVENRNPKTVMMLYDIMEPTWREWWPWRYPTYATDIVLNDQPHKHTLLYNPDKMGMQGIIYAPYRWNVTATNVTTISMAAPEFMPHAISTVPGAQANVTVHFDYINDTWWSAYWLPRWSSNPNWTTDLTNTLNKQHGDGWYLGVVYTVKMNREAAEAWLGMPQSADPATWWASNGWVYRAAWLSWISSEGNDRLDIYNAYEFAYADMGTVMDIQILPTGDVLLNIGHVSWGYEILINRWLTEATICTHAPYMEDFTLSAVYGESWADVQYDGVMEYSMKAVRANESTDGAAWAWEPQHSDYIASSGGHPFSEYDPWAPLVYRSWNAGDPLYGTDAAAYDATPAYLNLTSYQTLIFKVPMGDDVLGYKPGAVDPMAIANIVLNGDYSAYNSIMLNGSIQLGYYITNYFGGGANLDSMWDNGTKTLTMQGPMNFDQFHWGGGATGPIYHGAPWIEFNVTPTGVKALAKSIPVQGAGASGDSVAVATATVSDLTALAVIVAGTMVAIAALGCSARRMRET